MEWSKHLNSSEKKQIIVLAVALAGVIAFLVYIFVSLADQQKITIDEALEMSPEANRIDRMAMELSRMAPAASYNSEGQEVSQYEIQNPTDGGFGDDGTYDGSVDVMSESIQEVRRIQQSVDLSNGVPSSTYLNQATPSQPVETQPVQPVQVAPEESVPANSIGAIKPSVPAS